MKYINLAILIAIINLTWWLTRKPTDLDNEQHAKLQAVIQEYLGAYLRENNPKASEIVQPQVVTRVVDPGKKMQTQFQFSYYEEDENGSRNKVTRQGLFVLTSDNGNDWTAKMARIADSQVEFNDPLAVPRAKAGELKDEDPEQKTEAPATEHGEHH